DRLHLVPREVLLKPGRTQRLGASRRGCRWRSNDLNVAGGFWRRRRRLWLRLLRVAVEVPALLLSAPVPIGRRLTLREGIVGGGDSKREKEKPAGRGSHADDDGSSALLPNHLTGLTWPGVGSAALERGQ